MFFDCRKPHFDNVVQKIIILEMGSCLCFFIMMWLLLENNKLKRTPHVVPIWLFADPINEEI